MGEFVDKTAAREAELVWNRDSNLVRSDWVNGTGIQKKWHAQTCRRPACICCDSLQLANCAGYIMYLLVV